VQQHPPKPRGAIRLEARITEYLPRYRKDTGERMTVEQLLRHTSGLPPDFDAPSFRIWRRNCRAEKCHGSSERLEQNLRAMLFDQQPRMPSRNAKDVLGRAWLLPEERTVSHGSFRVVILLLLPTLVWQMARRRKGPRASPGV